MKSLNMRPGTLFLIGAIVLAAATAYFFYDYLHQVSKPRIIPEKAVVMSRNKAIPARQPITADMVMLFPVPQKMLLTNSIFKLEDVIGKWTLTAIKPCEQIRLSDIAEKGKLPGLAPSIPAGKRAITIGISDNKGVAGGIFAGDHVDIIANLKDPTRQGEQVVQVPLQNMLVLAVDKNSTDPTVGAVSSLTLCATPDEAQLITIAEEQGAIRVMLRARDDKEVIDDTSVSISKYLKRRSIQDEPKPAPKVKPPPPPPVVVAPPPPAVKKITIHIGKESKEYEVKISKGKETK
jgi:pilus assembly protein CpaB